ncbi:hypothetical protein [Microbispora sp. NBC_01389]|uniref:hypothetical protein n=1 Tax=Microbispora sp. NBC_01389 TaxID=2903584 RepID=UPI0032492C4D
MDIERAVFRANPDYELVLTDRLGAAERAQPGSAGEDDYGVLRPRPGAELDWRSVSCETALLFFSLAEPGPFPRYAAARLGDRLEETVARLVTDGVLQIRHEGSYVSGPPAGPLVFRAPSAGGTGRIGELSIAALRYGQRLRHLAEPMLAGRLYAYGRLPLSPRLRRRFPGEEAVASYLGIRPGAAWTAAWSEAGHSPTTSRHWRQWWLRSRSGETGRPASGYKLYVSPALDAMEGVVGTVAESLAVTPGVRAFKVGCDLPGVCRPDKIVAYFDRLDDLRRAAGTLEAALAGRAAHGVPFTAAVTGDGLLSWGADPPAYGREWGAPSSWRMWVSERLAEYLIATRAADMDGLEPWRFALDRLRAGGVDTDTWIPAGGMWPRVLMSG